jgi:DNA end-binding protein Ku
MRSIWKGSITFSLVSIPIKVFNAIETSEKISFNQLHAGACLGPIGQKKQCKKCDVTVTNDEIVKGYQHEKEKYVLVAPEEIAKITPESSEAIEIIGFIKPEEIPTTYFDASYFAAPNGQAAERSYALLREVMKRSGRIGVGKVILREREDLITISPNGDGLMIQKLHYRHEVRSVVDVPGISSQATPQDNELQLATTLVEQMVTTFDQIDTTDHFHAALKEMLDAKVAGETITTTGEVRKPAAVIDIMTALQASLKVQANRVEQEPTASPLTLVAPENGTPKTRRKRQAAA